MATISKALIFKVQINYTDYTIATYRSQDWTMENTWFSIVDYDTGDNINIPVGNIRNVIVFNGESIELETQA